jgi:hypothetical protein
MDFPAFVDTLICMTRAHNRASLIEPFALPSKVEAEPSRTGALKRRFPSRFLRSQVPSRGPCVTGCF